MYEHSFLKPFFKRLKPEELSAFTLRNFSILIAKIYATFENVGEFQSRPKNYREKENIKLNRVKKVEIKEFL